MDEDLKPETSPVGGIPRGSDGHRSDGRARAPGDYFASVEVSDLPQSGFRRKERRLSFEEHLQARIEQMQREGKSPQEIGAVVAGMRATQEKRMSQPAGKKK